MTCYMRHMTWIFEALELPYEKSHRTRVDRALRRALQTPEGATCPEVWAAIKALPEGERAALPVKIAPFLGE